eukprot:1173502-Prymnesium_polylepis.1
MATWLTRSSRRPVTTTDSTRWRRPFARLPTPSSTCPASPLRAFKRTTTHCSARRPSRAATYGHG